MHHGIQYVDIEGKEMCLHVIFPFDFGISTLIGSGRSLNTSCAYTKLSFIYIYTYVYIILKCVYNLNLLRNLFIIYSTMNQWNDYQSNNNPLFPQRATMKTHQIPLLDSATLAPNPVLNKSEVEKLFEHYEQLIFLHEQFIDDLVSKYYHFFILMKSM